MQHSFDINIAKKYGINCAVILNNIYFWVEKNRANETNFFDGCYWTYNTKKAFSALIPYLSERQIEYALNKLIDEGVIKTGNYNKSAYDRTLWYAITNFGYSILQNCGMEDRNMLNGIHSSVEPIPDINTDINKNNKTDIYKPPADAPDGDTHTSKKPVKHKYGEYNNVLLTEAELDKLKTKFPDWNSRIENLSIYIASKGAKYKSHYATILNWARRDKPERKNTGYAPGEDLTDLDDIF